MTVWEYYETDGDSGNYGSMLFTTEAAAKAYKLAKNDAYGQISKVTVHESNPLKPKPKKPAGAPDCPWCHAHLIKRSGRFGDFLGCATWPQCKYTRKLGIQHGWSDDSYDEEDADSFLTYNDYYPREDFD